MKDLEGLRVWSLTPSSSMRTIFWESVDKKREEEERSSASDYESEAESQTMVGMERMVYSQEGVSSYCEILAPRATHSSLYPMPMPMASGRVQHCHCKQLTSLDIP